VSTDVLDLDAYLGRIRYDGPRTPDLATLTVIHELHAAAFPFENLDVLLGRGVRLDLASIQQKLVGNRRGGYCFEQNTLLAAVLRAIGFDVVPMLARVRWQVPAENKTPQTHMILRVTIAGRPWLADAGFSAVGLSRPIALDTFEVQQTAYEPRRLARCDGFVLQQALIAGNWVDVFTSTLAEAYPIDFEVENWFTSTHPGSHFRHNLIVAKPDGPRRLSLANREFTIRQLDGSAEKQLLDSPEELLAVLADCFGLVFPAGTRFTCPGLTWPEG